MLIAGIGVIAALAFVLGLGAICLWALKRWGKMSLSARTRIAVEVVQRIPLGPKTGLAVVRVGEKVIAVSVGDGGIRTLFELDEADRQRIIASSQVPTPMISSNEATAAFVKFLPGAFGKTLIHALQRTPLPSSGLDAEPVAPTSMFATTTPTGPSIGPYATMRFNANDGVEIPSFLTAAPTTRGGQPLSYSPSSLAPLREPRRDPTRAVANPAGHADREFRAMLGGALSGATRLAVFAGAMILASAAVLPVHAQAAPPVVQPPTATPATAPQSTQSDAPVPPTAPKVSLPPSMRGAQPANTPKSKRGNGASVTPDGAAATRPMSKMQIDSAANSAKNPRAGAAQPAPIGADEAVMRMLPQMDVKLGDEKDGGLRLNGTVGIVVMMGLLTLLPTLLLMMTGFTRILIVLHFLKQAMGTQSAPPAQLLGALALLLTGFVMAPTLKQVNERAITPWLDGKINQVEMMKTGVGPMREFMLKQTRESDLKTFIEMSRLPRPNSADDVPLHVLMSAFVASELRTSFQIGFALYLPFIIIDAVVASVLMSMGMFMLPPAMISLPFKLLLFVLVDGWSLTISSLVQSFK